MRESGRDEARPPGRDVARAERGGVGVRHPEPCDKEPGEPQREDKPGHQGRPAMTPAEGAVQDHPRNRRGDPYERRKKQQGHTVGSCAAAYVASSPRPPDRNNGHHRGQPTEEDAQANSAEPAARRTRRLCSHGHLPHPALDAESTNATTQPAGAVAGPDTVRRFLGLPSRQQ